MKRLYRRIINYIRYDIPYGIKNIIKWFPTIWADRDWDHYFIYVTLRQKLHFTEQHIRKRGHHVASQQDADKIKTCVLLLDRLIADNYDSTFKKMDEKWGDIEISSTPCKDRPDLHEVHITRPNIKTEKDKLQEQKEFKNACEHEQYLKKQDRELLFKIISKNIEGWWD
jgi:hypothetical protein